jgi:DNA-binding transcriptional regulator YhcF (GntR family)
VSSAQGTASRRQHCEFRPRTSTQSSGTILMVKHNGMKRTSSAVDLLVRIDRTCSVPMRLQLERELRHAIQSGRLRHGSPLPSSRALASDLGLSRGVVVEAHEQLLAEGYLRADRGSATRVAIRSAAPGVRWGNRACHQNRACRRLALRPRLSIDATPIVCERLMAM